MRHLLLNPDKYMCPQYPYLEKGEHGSYSVNRRGGISCSWG